MISKAFLSLGFFWFCLKILTYALLTKFHPTTEFLEFRILTKASLHDNLICEIAIPLGGEF